MSRRFTHVIGLRPDAVATYKELHAQIWPDIAEATRRAGLHNYSIHLCELPDRSYYLFSYFEYSGTDIEADLASLAGCPRMAEWTACCEACQLPLANRDSGAWWSSMEEVFYQK